MKESIQISYLFDIEHFVNNTNPSMTDEKSAGNNSRVDDSDCGKATFGAK